MAHIKFLRYTHIDHKVRGDISKDASEFWRNYGGLIGHMLDSVNPMSLSEIVSACQCYKEQHEDDVSIDAISEQYVAWCLVKMAEYGMVKIVLGY